MGKYNDTTPDFGGRYDILIKHRVYVVAVAVGVVVVTLVAVGVVLVVVVVVLSYRSENHQHFPLIRCFEENSTYL